MKPLFPERIRSAILPALLMAVAGGLGCFTMVFPDSSPKWLRTPVRARVAWTNHLCG